MSETDEITFFKEENEKLREIWIQMKCKKLRNFFIYFPTTK